MKQILSRRTALSVVWIFMITILVTASSSAPSNSSENTDVDNQVSPTETTPNSVSTNASVPMSASTAKGSGIIPNWINSTQRRRATKLLVEPLASQLQENVDKLQNDNGEQENLLDTRVPPSITKKHRGGSGNNGVRRQEIDLTYLVTEGPQVDFPSIVSPIESSLGGLSGLQGLPPLSLVQFLKLLVAVTPFMIPLVFIPLLIFTVGLTLLPISRSNVFVDVGDLRSSNRDHFSPSSMLSTYVLNPVKTFTGSVVMPRAYEVSNLLVDHEQCVERFSCEISSRLHLRHKWDGQVSWRSFANTNWISRLLMHFWGTKPTVARIARNLNSWSSASDAAVEGRLNEPRSISGSPQFYSPRGNESAPLTCSQRYSCQPRNFLRKLL